MIPIRLNFSIMLCGNAARIRLSVSIFGFIRLKIRPMESNKKHEAKGSEVKPDKDTIKIALAVLRQRKRYLWLDGLTIRGNIGIDGDAAATALLCGAANSLLPRIIRFLLANKGAHAPFVRAVNGYCRACYARIIGLNNILRSFKEAVYARHVPIAHGLHTLAHRHKRKP